MNNKRTIKLLGSPEVGKELELPDIAELLFVPMFMGADVEDAYKYGGEIYRKFLDLTPLKNDKKYVTLTSYIQYLDPSIDTIKFLNCWHIDGSNSIFTCDERNHFLISDATCRTEFIENDVLVDLPVSAQYNSSANSYLNDNAEKFGFIPKSIEPNRFVTFTAHHPHRAVKPKRREFRWIFRVTESDDKQANPEGISKALNNTSYAFVDDKKLPNIEQTKNGVFIFDPKSFI